MSSDSLADCATTQSQKRSSNRMNNNMEFSRNTTTSIPSDVPCDQNVVMHSNLTPTAREFTPSNAHVAAADSGHVMKSKGAVRKQYFKQSYDGGPSYQFSHDRYSKKERGGRNNKYSDEKHRLEYAESDFGSNSRFSQNRYDRSSRSNTSENYNGNRMYYGKGNNRYRENNRFSKGDVKDDKWRNTEIKGNKQSANLTENKVVSRRNNSSDLLKKKCK